MKTLVLGNCQARPVLDILLRAVPHLERMEPVILHLARPEEQPAHVAAMQDADLILAQYTDPRFQPTHLASAAIKAAHPDKTLIWSNVFYAGQQPFLRYLTHTSAGRLMGPLDAYHDLRILRDWEMDRRGTDTLAVLPDPETIHQRSLAALRGREVDCDAGATDLIEAERRNRKLFFSFNHPSRWLLEHLCARLAKAGGLQFARPDGPVNEPLGRITVPSTWHAFEGEKPDLYGPETDLSVSGRITVQGRRKYDAKTLRNASFAAYDHIAPLLTAGDLRFTPDY